MSLTRQPVGRPPRRCQGGGAKDCGRGGVVQSGGLSIVRGSVSGFYRGGTLQVDLLVVPGMCRSVPIRPPRTESKGQRSRQVFRGFYGSWGEMLFREASRGGARRAGPSGGGTSISLPPVSVQPPEPPPRAPTPSPRVSLGLGSDIPPALPLGVLVSLGALPPVRTSGPRPLGRLQASSAPLWAHSVLEGRNLLPLAGPCRPTP